MAHLVRKLFNKTGIDIHRYRQSKTPIFYLQKLDIRTVIDVGANVGQFAKEIRLVLPNARIISFEPLHDCYAKLIHVMSKDTNFTAYPIAIGETSGDVPMNRSSYSPSSSLRPMAAEHKRLFPHTAVQTIEHVRVERLDDILAKEELLPGILIKVDAQGYEDKVIAGGRRIFQRAEAVVLESSFAEYYTNQPLFDDIYGAMRDMGFNYHGAMQQKMNPSTGEILFEDSLFIRDKTK